MYDELVKRLWECVSGECWNCSQHKDSYDGQRTCADNLMKQAADAIEELSKPKWIPVTERLPESVCKSYLCLTDTGYHCEARWTNNVYGLWKSDNEWGWSIADVPKYCKITHWMPLPEPPKEE